MAIAGFLTYLSVRNRAVITPNAMRGAATKLIARERTAEVVRFCASMRPATFKAEFPCVAGGSILSS